jgi:putative membrane-bound dehydrogenase-like protein
MKRVLSTSLMALLALASLSVGQGIIEKSGTCPTLARYTPPEDWTTFPIEPSPTSTYPTNTVQSPLNPFQSINCTQVPVGMKAQIMVSELTPGPAPALAYLMYITFDERGRIWAVDTRDYPNNHNAAGTTWTNPSTNRLNGSSRVVIVEDTNSDGAFDRYKVFYTGLVMPTSIEIVKNGVVVTTAPNIYFIPRSNSNPDTAGGTPTAVVTGMGSTSADFDSHGQTNSLTRGLDNFIYGHTGYNGCGSPVVGGNAGVGCSGGNLWRFKATAVGSDTNVFQIHSTGTTSNAHGIGQMEDGQFFKSGATLSSHSMHQVRHNTGETNILGSVGNNANHVFYPMTRDLYLWEGSSSQQTGGFYSSQTSAVSGHDFYTARLLPRKYWNRFAFACEGATKLCNQDSLVENGATWSALRMPGPVRSNIFASTDAWTAPFKVRTGPEGGLWVVDWYNYLFLHNPAGPATNAAWNNVMRAKSRTRLYRIIPAEGNMDPVLNLTNVSNSVLVAALYNTNFLWRMQAQRLLIERGFSAEIGNLLDSVLTNHRTVDAVGIDGPVLHALWTLHGMKQFTLDSARWNPKLRNLLLHPAWTVRRNVVLAMPPTAISAQSIGTMCAVNDVHAHVRVQALQNLARMPVATGGPLTSLDGLRSDTHITAAYTAAGTTKVGTATGSARPGTCPAYLATSDSLAGFPVGIKAGASFARRAVQNLNFDVRPNAFSPVATPNLVSGEITVTDLRGHTVFRSTYNKSTRTWSQASAANMPHPFYFYSFKGTNGTTFNGRIAMTSNY